MPPLWTACLLFYCNHQIIFDGFADIIQQFRHLHNFSSFLSILDPYISLFDYSNDFAHLLTLFISKLNYNDKIILSKRM